MAELFEKFIYAVACALVGACCVQYVYCSPVHSDMRTLKAQNDTLREELALQTAVSNDLRSELREMPRLISPR